MKQRARPHIKESCWSLPFLSYQFHTGGRQTSNRPPEMSEDISPLSEDISPPPSAGAEISDVPVGLAIQKRRAKSIFSEDSPPSPRNLSEYLEEFFTIVGGTLFAVNF